MPRRGGEGDMASKNTDQWHVMGVIWSCMAVAAAAMVFAGVKALSVSGILR